MFHLHSTAVQVGISLYENLLKFLVIFVLNIKFNLSDSLLCVASEV